MQIVQVDNSNYKKIMNTISNRSKKINANVDKIVENIIKEVKEKGDAALLYYSSKFDGFCPKSFIIDDSEIENAFNEVENDFISILEEAKDNIWDYHSKQLQNSWMTYKNDGIMLGQKVTPIERIGVYVPGGKAAYPSTLLMNVIPAKVAGVKSIAVVTPPNRNGKVNPYVLAAAKICGVNEIYSIGGAQAVAALAYGTETIPAVDKIVGPGNIYVARAKRMVFGDVDIDMIAGPSEICIVADNSADPCFIASDLLSQAEHDELASPLLVTTSQKLAEGVIENIRIQMKELKRIDIIQKSIEDMCTIFIVDSIYTALDVVNRIAPEHLEIMVDNPFEVMPGIKNAGAIFIGKYSPEPLGDYFAGPNHTLPTSGTARFSSPLGVDDFIKKSSIIYYSQDELYKIKDNVIMFAEKEGLDAHANSIKVRFKI